MPPRDLMDELDDLENGDEEPVSNRTFARIMRHLFCNHLWHIQADIDRCKWSIWILFGALSLILSVVVAMLAILLTG